MNLQKLQLVPFLVMIMIGIEGIMGEGILAAPNITLEQEVHFLSPDGDDVQVSPGQYEVEIAETWLKLVPGERRDAWLIEATTIMHDEDLLNPVAFSVLGEEADQHHILLMLPGGKGLEAVGSYSGVRSRSGSKSLISRVRQQHALTTQRQNLKPIDSNPCVSNVQKAFRAIRTHGDKLAFWNAGIPRGQYKKKVTSSAVAGAGAGGSLGGVPGAAVGGVVGAAVGGYSSSKSHFQGIQRLRRGPYVAISGSSTIAGDLFIIKLGSRSSTDRFRSNRLRSSNPPNIDKVAKYAFRSTTHHHAGGLDVMGDYLVLGLGGGKPEKVVFFDVSNPMNPRKIYSLEGLKSASSVSITKQTDGTFLLVISGANADYLDFYLSAPNASLSNPQFTKVDRWNKKELSGLDRKWGRYQNIDFVNQCDGSIFLVGTHKQARIGEGNVIGEAAAVSSGGGEDWADLFKVALHDLPNGRARASLRKIDKRHMYCQDACNFQAGAGVFVGPVKKIKDAQGKIREEGQLFLYGVEHWKKGGIVRFNEFRPVPTSSISPLTTINAAWVELYDDRGFKDRSIMIDFRDQSLRNYLNYDKVEGFEDKTSSAKWLLPKGWQYLLFEDKLFKGRMLKLTGTGRVGSISDLKTRGWNDKVSSSRFMKNGITRLDQAWIELFDDSNFKDRRLTVKEASGSIKNYKKITVEGKKGFGDKVSSARYIIPRGYVYRLYEHDSYRGKTLELVGTGTVQEISNFNSRRFNDKVSSSKFVRK